MKAPEWKAKWIWKNNKVEINSFAFFRKEIRLEKDIREAKIFVSAHNHFELYVSGIRVSGYVTPAPSHPQKSKYYLCYEVTHLLGKGTNTIGAVVHYLGGGGQNYVNGLPGFILQCEAEYEDGSRDTFITDESWKALEQTPFRDGTEYQQNRKISAIEDYDATLETDWLKSGFDDSAWLAASLSPINDEGWILKPQTIPEGKIYEIITPSITGVQEKGVQIFDAGKIISGWPRLDIEGIEGVQLMMRYSEDLTSDGRVKHNVANEKSENYYDLYRMKGQPREIWEPCLSYKAFRYVEVTGYPGILKPENVKIVSAGTGLSYEGHFNCSNPLLNDIYKACIQTQKNNVVGQMTDCPHREQAQYLADSDLQSETMIYNFFNPEVLRKVLLDFKDGQLDDGRFQFVFPSNSTPRFDVKIPEWDLHFCTLLWKVYFYYNDKNILEECYDAGKKTLSYYWGIRDKETGLVPKGKGFPEAWNISDWPYPDIDHSGSALTVQNCLLYHVLGLMGRIASILGLESDRLEFENKAACMKESIVKYFYDPERKLFADSLDSEQSHQGTNVVAYQYGLVPEDARDVVLDFIIRQGFGCSTLLSLNLLQILFENGKGQEAYNLINRTEYPGWGYMIEQGYKTIWEGFQNTESHSHAWNAYPARIFAEYLVGIKAAAPGFEKIDVKPYIPSDMMFAEAKVPTVKGNISVRWERRASELTIELATPADTETRVFIPRQYCTNGIIKVSDKLIWQNGSFSGQDGIEYCGEDSSYIIFKTVSGKHLFKVG